MNTEKRISFVSNHLVEQIIQGKKTASVDWLDQQGELDEYDSELTVGDYYVVYDSERKPRCTIRITMMKLCRWDNIPEWLWRGETNESADEFRLDHIDYFNNPEKDFEFVGYEFQLIAE